MRENPLAKTGRSATEYVLDNSWCDMWSQIMDCRLYLVCYWPIALFYTCVALASQEEAEEE